MNRHSRREFFADVGRGMLVASVGSALAADMGLSRAWADEGGGRLTFGDMEPLVGLMQETPINKLQPLLVKKLQAGDCDLQELVAAASLANARKFGGEDYVGFHTIMALAPAYQIAREMPADRRPLPVLKVLYRNTDNIQKNGGAENEVLHPVEKVEIPADRIGGELLRRHTRRPDVNAAEGVFAALADGDAEDAYNDLQYAVQDDTDVHRVVLAHRAWSLLDLVGMDHAHTMLRESVRYCVKSERDRIGKGRPVPEIRSLLPKLMDEHRLPGKPLGTRSADDGWIDEMARTIHDSTPAESADAAAAALAEGFSVETVAEAMSLAANALVLRDRNQRIHGASIGVHGSDSANAWRNIARVSNPRNAVASIIVGAYHISRGAQPHQKPYPLGSDRESIKSNDPARLLYEAEEAIRENDQGRACAAVERYGNLGHPAKGAFELLRRYAISEDGRLHGEKYYVTVKEEFSTTRPAFRWRHLVGLARATASAHGYTVDDRPGYRAPGYEEACRLLQVEL